MKAAVASALRRLRWRAAITQTLRFHVCDAAASNYQKILTDVMDNQP